MNYNVFNNEPIAEQANDYACHIALLPTSKTIQDEDGNDIVIAIDNTVYSSGTTLWSIPFQRATDNKWVYPVCPSGDIVYNTEVYSSDWKLEEI